MPRTLPRFLLLVGLLLSGCGRSADPLDWKIEGHHSDELQASLNEITDHLSPKLGREFGFCVENVRADALNGLQNADAEQRNNALCRRLRDKSARDILIEGNELALRAITTQVAVQSEKLIRLLNVSDRQPEAKRAYHAQSIEYTKALIESLNQQQAKVERRLADLQAQAH